MSKFFFNGSVSTKVDDKNRFVLPQAMRYGLIENGELEFTIALGLGGSLAIYKRSDINKIVEKFQKKQHDARYQKFFTLFFSTLHHTTCDKLGRVVIPAILKRAAGIEGEIVVAGVLNKIEIWPKAKYEEDLLLFLTDTDSDSVLAKMTREAFALFDEGDKEETSQEPLAALNTQDKVAYEEI